MGASEERRIPPTNKTELILYRLDGIDKKLVDLQVLMTQTALQEQRIAQLEADAKEHAKDTEKIILLEQTIKELKDAKKTSDAKWWQILLLILSPIVSAIMTYAIMGGFHGVK